MEIEYIKEQGTGTINEDHLFIDTDVFGVFDGSTSLDGLKFKKGKTGGWLAANIAVDVFQKNNHSLWGLAEKANNEIQKAMQLHGVDLTERTNRWSASMAVVKIVENHVEWIQTGDCVILAIHDNGGYTLLADGSDHDRGTLLQWKRLAGNIPGTIHELLTKQIRNVREQTNITYGALNGEESALKFFKSGKKTLRDVRHLLIFTDGLMIPREDPENEVDYDLLVRLFLKSGLLHVRDYIRNLEKSDPSCRRFPRFKPHDDIAAVSLAFS